MGEEGSAKFKLTTPVKLEPTEEGVKLIFVPTNSGYSANDKKDRDKKDDDDEDATPKKKRSEGGVWLVATDGSITAKRCDYDPGTIIKQMSEDRIIEQLKVDAKVFFKN